MYLCTSIQNGMTALHHATKNGHLTTVKMLVEEFKCDLSKCQKVSVQCGLCNNKCTGFKTIVKKKHCHGIIYVLYVMVCYEL